MPDPHQTPAPDHRTAPDRSARSGLRLPPTWPVLLLTLPAFVAIWSGWVGLGQMSGFGLVNPLPGIADDLWINTAITLPIGMEVYAAYALHVWLSPAVPERARRFARWSAIGSLIIGAGGQVAYHLLTAAGIKHAPWPITAAVACLPVIVLGMGAALARLVRAGDDEPDPQPQSEQTPTGPADHEPVREPEPVLVPLPPAAWEPATGIGTAPVTDRPADWPDREQTTGPDHRIDEQSDDDPGTPEDDPDDSPLSDAEILRRLRAHRRDHGQLTQRQVQDIARNPLTGRPAGVSRARRLLEQLDGQPADDETDRAAAAAQN